MVFPYLKGSSLSLVFILCVIIFGISYYSSVLIISGLSILHLTITSLCDIGLWRDGMPTRSFGDSLLTSEKPLIPREMLWEQLIDFEVPDKWRDVIYRIYIHVKSQIKTQGVISKSLEVALELIKVAPFWQQYSSYILASWKIGSLTKAE